VKTAQCWGHEVGFERVAFYSDCVSVADVVENDGSHLERVGIVPDELLVPTQKNLADKYDPILVRAMEKVGVTRTADQLYELLSKPQKP
jgi:hypothetical protein